ncbi:MAG: Bifunctional sugar kinase/adenylyltransferase [Bacteroidetes bacterium]|nr:Bifunctional sugar kinase/adenylyltransferase [Bacteroidota bacterium]
MEVFLNGMNLDEAAIDRILAQFQGKRIAVLGDLMLDRYFWGSVHRISPEAPVPVVEVESESVRFGGAANVANNILALGGVPLLIGLVGNDHPGEIMAEMLTERGLDTSGLIMDADRPTTIKTRVIASDQHVVRIDNEAKTPCPEELQSRIVDGIRYHIHAIDAILIEDYNKGVITKPVIDEVLAVARKYNKIVTVDPKFDNFLEFKGVTVFKPNRRETEEVLGGRLRTDEEVEAAGRRLLELLGAENVLLTRGADGMSLFQRDGGWCHLPTAAEHVVDVSGAGDTVISTLTIALAAGAPMRDACLLANCAGGVVVGSVGIVPVTPDQIRAAAVRLIGSRQQA